ncbi:hypothetical protein [Peribacillus muralis]|uniref:hypothetical protein n=1 Tax=Peribacillus muralis TaxID=264697 RepID=UPI00366FD766
MDNFKQAIVNGDFVKAKHTALNMDVENLKEILFVVAYDEENIAPYSFVNYLLVDKETSELHHLASFLLSMALNHINGAYQTACFHAKKAAELSPDDISFKEYLLLFYDLPEQLISKEEANKIAKEILMIDPDNATVKSIF